jgi:hypothetical protein
MWVSGSQRASASIVIFVASFALSALFVPVVFRSSCNISLPVCFLFRNERSRRLCRRVLKLWFGLLPAGR